MKNFNTGLRYFFLLFVIAVLAGCWGGRSSGSGNSISGIASKGPINGGNVEVFALHADGTRDVLLGTATTATDGLYTVGIGNYSDPVLVEVWGGTYVDEATGATLTNTLLRAVLPSSQGNVSAAVTAFTELATLYAEQLGGLTLDNIIAANALVSALFGGMDIIATEPVDVLSTPTGGVSQQEIDYGLMLAGLSQMVANDPSLNNVTDLLALLAADMADGVLDVSGGDFSGALIDFLASANNQTGITSVNAMSIDTAPAQVSGLSVIAAGSNQINLSWTATTDDVSSQANLVYEICQSNSTGGCDTFTVSKTTTGGAITSNVSGLEPLSTYYFKLRAKDEVGNIGSASVEVSGITDPIGTVNAPTFSPVAGTYGSTQNVSISSTTPGATQCYTTDGVTDPACDASALCTTGTTYTGAVSVSTTQSLRAMACMASYTSSSITSAAYTIDTTAPLEVSGLSAIAVSSNQINLSWTDPADSDFDHVEITWNLGGGIVQTVNKGVGTYTTTSLTAVVEYTFTIKTVDSFGNVTSGITINATPNSYDEYYTWGGFTENLNGTISFEGEGSYLGQNLIFMKCSQGQVWNAGSNACDGVPGTYQYCSTDDNSCDDGTTLNGTGTSSAYDSCNSLNTTPAGGYAGKTSWRVPSIVELRVLVHCTDRTMPLDGDHCGVGNFIAPTVNNLFPGTAVYDYWSATASATYPMAAYTFYTGVGSTHAGGPPKSEASVNLRCVATGP